MKKHRKNRPVACPVALLRIDRAASRHTAHPRHLHPPLDLKYLQAVLAERLAVTPPLLDGWLAPFAVDRFVADTLALAPRVAVIRAVSWCLEEALAVGQRLRRAGVVTIVVGQLVAHHRQLPVAGWADAFDLAIDGEPEALAADLVKVLLDGIDAAEPSAGILARLLESSPSGTFPARVDAPDSLPLPNYSREELAAYRFPFALPGLPALTRFAYVLTAWGCPRPCRHCTAIVRRSVARPLRPRAIGAVADEVAALRDAGAQAIFFDDDSLFVHRPRLLELADTLVRRGLTLPWVANARPDELDAERVAAARAAGAVLLKVGIETGSQRLIEAIGKAADGGRWIMAAETAFALLHRSGIGSVGLFMVGLPGETLADAEATAALALRLEPDYLQIQSFRAYPDIDWWPQLPEVIRNAAAAGDYHYLAAAANCSDIPDTLLAALPGQIYRRFYLRANFAARHLRRNWRHYSSPIAWRGSLAALSYLLGWKRNA
jgi:radical SAM superfamily enzyme YgiQ (UPF0313 family)